MAKNNVPVSAGETSPKPKRKQGSWLGNMTPLSTEEGGTRELINLTLAVGMIPKADLHDPESVGRAIGEYFKVYADYDMKPTVAGLSMVLGLDRRRLWEISVGKYDTGNGKIASLPTQVLDFIKKAYNAMEVLWESSFNSGKINPVAGIFLAKNQFGYQDKTEYVLTPNANDSNDYNEDEIKKRYATLPDASDSGDSDDSLQTATLSDSDD